MQEAGCSNYEAFNPIVSLEKTRFNITLAHKFLNVSGNCVEAQILLIALKHKT